jgi:hypothetical protein
MMLVLATTIPAPIADKGCGVTIRVKNGDLPAVGAAKHDELT